MSDITYVGTLKKIKTVVEARGGETIKGVKSEGVQPQYRLVFNIEAAGKQEARAITVLWTRTQTQSRKFLKREKDYIITARPYTPNNLDDSFNAANKLNIEYRATNLQSYNPPSVSNSNRPKMYSE